MTFDPEKYREHIADLDLSESEQDVLLQQLWLVAEGFADQAWGLRPEQAVACGQVEGSSPNSALTAPFRIECLDKIIANEFKNAAGEEEDARRKEDIHEAAET